jgi:hypothetical protein
MSGHCGKTTKLILQNNSILLLSAATISKHNFIQNSSTKTLLYTEDHSFTDYTRYKRCEFLFCKDQDCNGDCSIGIFLTSVTNTTVFWQGRLSMQGRSTVTATWQQSSVLLHLSASIFVTPEQSRSRPFS